MNFGKRFRNMVTGFAGHSPLKAAYRFGEGRTMHGNPILPKTGNSTPPGRAGGSPNARAQRTSERHILLQAIAEIDHWTPPVAGQS
jgi:hypothetical protein